MRFFVYFLLCAGLLFHAPAHAQETYDLIFKTGTLDELQRDSKLTYERAVETPTKPEVAEAANGKVEMVFDSDELVNLKFLQGEKYRKIGEFPANVGNPVIMYFVETVVRDMAQTAGGSPFYIRNRVKDSLVQFAEIESGTATFDGAEVAVQEITLRPFLKDPNKDRMKGFGELALTITMSDDVPGWYHSLSAYVDAAPGAEPVYSNTLTLMPLEQVE
ncbi:hypothetical protein [Actibacterium lipolyticum]|uniref:Uncharacterized protein n=1 Tax=Actibacterium lipolyticum TaxID=1524263 RepID=A0A238JNW3_9RHOB|nr:hypothetical protein [Actibacterium lipolyticum]SMX32360.1 hypothetical protein COL8621_00794 [Actibacterium lipolyticum]